MAVSPAASAGRPESSANRACPAIIYTAQIVPGSPKITIGPTSGRCQSCACTRSRHHIRLKSWVAPSISSPTTPRSPAKCTRSCGGCSSRTSPSSKRRRRPLPDNSTSARSMPGNDENAASHSISAIDRRQPQSSPSGTLTISRVQPSWLRQRTRRYSLAGITREPLPCSMPDLRLSLRSLAMQPQPRQQKVPPPAVPSAVGGARPCPEFPLMSTGPPCPHVRRRSPPCDATGKGVSCGWRRVAQRRGWRWRACAPVRRQRRRCGLGSSRWSSGRCP